eukprot:15480177-Alexandrium_andersonii.AAC.1
MCRACESGEAQLRPRNWNPHTQGPSAGALKEAAEAGARSCNMGSTNTAGAGTWKENAEIEPC